MFSKITSTLSLLAIVASVSASPLVVRDVWQPSAILEPTADTVWYFATGTTETVSWSLEGEPASVSNAGRVTLAYNGVEVASGPGSYCELSSLPLFCMTLTGIAL